MSEGRCILGLVAETSIHAGTGQTTGIIDLPIQREAHTGWPCIFGSAVKGALRTKAEDHQCKWVKEVFGPETANAGDHAGALLVGDARLLLLPVRSLTSHFKYVTCPALLRRCKADAARMGISLDSEVPVVNDGTGQPTALLPKATSDLFLEELRFAPKEYDLRGVIVALARFMGGNDAAKILEQQLVIVSDDLFNHLAQHATPVAAHIQIDNKTKTVKSGALWYEETLPSDTVLYVCVVAQDSRKNGKADGGLSAAGIIETCITGELFGTYGPYLQLGGNETVGMGWCRVTTVRNGQGS